MLKINENKIVQAKLNGNNITQIKLNGELYNLSNLVLSFANKIISTNNTQKVDIYYADNTGILADYDKVCTLENTEYNYFNNLNFAPVEAAKIVACTYKTQSILAECSIPTDFKETNLGTKLYSVGLLSDIHIDGDGTDEASASADFKRALTYFNTRASAVCCAGDLCCENGYNELTTFKSLVDNNAIIPVYSSRGNHDTRYPLSDWNTIGYELYEEKTINNEHYLFLGMNTESFGDNCFTTEELDWLEQKLISYANERVYLFFHVFSPNTCGDVNNLYPWNKLDTTSATIQRFLTLMTTYKNVIYFSGHSHLSFSCQKFGANANVFSNGTMCKRVHIPSCAKPRNSETGNSADGITTISAGSEGYLMDVYENYIVLKGIDFTKLKILPIAHYIINTTPKTIVTNKITPTVRLGTLSRSDGTESSSTEYVITTFLDISGATSLVLSNNTSDNSNNMCLFYDENKAFLTAWNGSYNYKYVTNGGTIEIPANAKYLRVRISTSDTSTVLTITKEV